MPAGSFWVLKIPFINKNVEHLQNEISKRNAIGKYIF